MRAELIRRAVEFTNGPPDVPDEQLAEVFAPDVVLDFSARVFNPKVYEGYDGLREFRAEADEVWERVEVTATSVDEQGDEIHVRAQVRARGRASGLELDVVGEWIWEVSGDRLSRFRLLS